MKCDRPECERDVDEESAHLICVELRSYRVNTQRWWRFCGAECRDAWYDAGDEQDLLRHTTDEEHASLQAERAAAYESAVLEDGIAPSEEWSMRDLAFAADGEPHDNETLARVRAAEKAVGDAVAGFVDSDRDIEYRVHHVTKRGKDVPLVEGREALLHDGPESVNTYWRTPAGS